MALTKASLDRMKKDNECDHLLTFGYLRRAQKEYKHLNIATALWNLFFLFGIEYDRFAEWGIALRKIESNETIINVDDDKGGSCYGRLSIDNSSYSAAFIYQWKFRITKFSYGPTYRGFIAIGIVDDRYRNLGSTFYGDAAHNWHISATDEGDIYKTEWNDPIGNNKELYMESSIWDSDLMFEEGDQITLSYSAEFETLEYAVHDQAGKMYCELEINNINFEFPELKYKLAIFMKQK